MNTQDNSHKLEIYFGLTQLDPHLKSCKSLAIHTFKKAGKDFNACFETEDQPYSENMQFQKYAVLPYNFSEDQLLRFELVDSNHSRLIGLGIIAMAKLINLPGQ
mmetsp:Transcript_16643/g.14523  ORF Transcript_16643/g.14523 Transcript_16643/m.14523 type:complete len:104 (-) Transcript_16643:3977-4288(-)